MPQSALCPLPFALLAGMSVLAGWGCDVTIKDGDISVNHGHGKATREWRRTYPLSATGVVEIVNDNGPIEVSRGADGTVDVNAVLTAKAMTEDRAKQILSESGIEESATPERVRVASSRGNRGRGPGGLEVSYKVTMPPGARLEMSGNNGAFRADALTGHVKALVTNGSVELTDLAGSVDAAAINGRVSLKMAQVTGRIRLEATNGRIDLEIPAKTKAVLDARSMNGAIRVTGLSGQEVSGRRIQTLESQLNGGGPEIDIRVTNGRISITGK
jgi:hypothetical protein